MPKKKYLVTLTADERTQLEQLLRGGQAATRKVTRARILPKASAGWPEQPIAAALNLGRATVERTRRRFVEENLAALAERPRPGNKPKLDSRAEARLSAEACSPAPEGCARWTLQLLADRVVQLKLAASYSYEAVRRGLKKTRSSRGCKSKGVSRKARPSLSPAWKRCWNSMPNRMLRAARTATSMQAASNSLKSRAQHLKQNPDNQSALIPSIKEVARASCFSSLSHKRGGGRSTSPSSGRGLISPTS